ncbi:SPOSA6832_01455 [Sporobolomyces salmonicolor]|uniref:SPOSA6832_01455-mRNA-1:cds n=1 Tax=Sporidiobolus salmonicolor TaxID=5005 RepID=A0A0D6EIT0_SPOSA|nr:SPOSA6832_01455 [Sporobolomyces salmonicolor]
MLADLDLAMRSPHQLIQNLFSETSSLESFEQRVSTTFASLFQHGSARRQLPTITALSTSTHLPPTGTLVRFRAMVQDTGFGSELYRALGAEDEVLMYGVEEPETSTAVRPTPPPPRVWDETADSLPLEQATQAEVYNKLRERQVFYVVSPPGETNWVKESTSAGSLVNKFPLPSEPHFGIIAKASSLSCREKQWLTDECCLQVYGDAADKMRTTDVYEFVGILGETTYVHVSSAFDDLAYDSAASHPVVPALHVILALPVPRPSLPSTCTDSEGTKSIRKELAGTSTPRNGFCSLSSRECTHTRHATGLALGALSLNLALPPSFSTDLSTKLASLVPALAILNPTIASLNDSKTRMAPRSRDESLESGQLQLAGGTVVLVDMRGLAEGKLEDTGVRNLRHLATTVAQQKLAYAFPFSSFDLDTDLGFILLSEGKAIVPTDCVVYVKPDDGFKPSTTAAPSSDQLDGFRSFLSTMKAAEFTIPEEMSEVIQTDFVERRQQSHGGEAMSQEDLLFRMTAARYAHPSLAGPSACSSIPPTSMPADPTRVRRRLMALSHGRTKLSPEAWLQTAELDERRKERVPVAPPQGKQ